MSAETSAVVNVASSDLLAAKELTARTWSGPGSY